MCCGGGWQWGLVAVVMVTNNGDESDCNDNCGKDNWVDIIIMMSLIVMVTTIVVGNGGHC